MSSPSTQRASALLSGSLKAFSLVSIATGSFDIFLGLEGIKALCEPLAPTAIPATSSFAALVDTQTRFFGAMWAGYGVMLWWTSNDVVNRRTPLALLAGILFVSGVGRAASALQYGFSAPWIQAITAIDVLAPFAMFYFGVQGTRNGHGKLA